MEKFPSIINVVSDERADNYIYFPKGAAIEKNKDILVVSEDNIATLSETYNLPCSVKDGDVLVRNPYEVEPTYVNVTEAAERLWLAKCAKITDLMGKLGATKCEFVSCTVNTKRRDSSVNTNGSYKLISAEVSVNQQMEEKMKKELNLTCVFDKSIVLTHSDWEKVKKEATDCNLWQDDYIRNIITQHEPDVKRSPMKRVSLSCKVASETNKALDIAFKLTCCEAFSLNADIKDKISCYYETTVNYNIEF